MSIRVIAGTAKGRRLKLVPGEGTRPMMDRVKQALFNILGESIVEARVLDLFAGTGSVGIEALSRGAAYAEFVESGRSAANTIRENLRHTELSALARIVRSDVFIYLRNAPRAARPEVGLEKRGADPDRPGIGRASPSALPRAGFDYVHVAPPQYQGLWAKTLLALDAKPGWVNPDGVICVQIGPKEYTSQTLQHFQLIDERKYGNTLLCLYERLIES